MNIEIDAEPVIERVTAMTDRVQSFGRGYVLPELITWQEEDMRRHFPNAEVESLSTVFTLIWPRSRTYDERHKGQHVARRRMVRSLSSMPRLRGVATAIGQRPILRPELFDKLVTRMITLMEEKLSWQSTSQP